jgi:GAF domain-containing protein
MPLVNLSRAALRIGGGDLSVPVQIQGAQEIATLGESLEKMRIELEKNVTYLEKRVQERTIDLETARQSAEDRAQELQTIGEVTNIIAREQRLDILLPLITQAISDKFGFYHTGLFLLDNARRYAVLQAANSEGGKRMLAREHKLEVGLTGIVGNVAQTGKPRIAMDVGEDAVYFDNPDLPQTRSEMALPLIIRNETIGVLDVQSIEAGIFKESDVSILSILADQVAVAIENARLAGQKQQALEEIDALYRQYLSQQWLSFAGQAKNLGYHQSNIGGKTITQVMETKEIRKALEDGKTIINHAQNEKAEATLTAPVQLRGQTIGVLNIKAPVKGHKWTDDEINMVQAVSERLALALENARLITVAQRRAETERAISDMTAKIGSSINLQNILQTAVDELGRVLPQSDIVIQFQGKEDE